MFRITTLVLAWVVGTTTSKSSPNILFILSDDLGFNDVGFHGSTQIPTPNIDEIANTGIILNNYHAQPVCSPTRSSLMSGRHVIHTGIYMPFSQGTNLRLSLNYTLLPAYLKKLGYATHMVGKWHIGQNELAALPTSRGFDSYFGYLSGAEDYYTHSTKGAYDLSDGIRTAFEYNGTYSTGLWVTKVVDVIQKSSESVPFFIYLPFQNVHWPLEAPKKYMDMFAKSTGGDKRRQSVCAMAAVMDEGIGQILAALKKKGVYDDTMIIFASDNGGPTNNNEGTWSSNYPMRGGKNTLWEGGTRVVGAIRGPGLMKEMIGKVTYGKIHVTDWLPTLVRVASGDKDWLQQNMPKGEEPFQLGDGMDIWDFLSTGKEVRTEIIKECHPPDHLDLVHGNALIVGDWKIAKFGQIHPSMEAGWVPPPGQDAGKVSYQLPCDRSQQPSTVDTEECTKTFCLFNVTADPCEYHNRAADHPDVVARLQKRLAEYQATAVPPVSGKDCGCEPVITKGAWRPCDSPDPDGSMEDFVGLVL